MTKALSKPEIKTAIEKLWEDTKSSVSLYKKTENRAKAKALKDAALALNAKDIACQAGLLLCLIERDITQASPPLDKKETGRGHTKSRPPGGTLSNKTISKMRTAYGSFSDNDIVQIGEALIEKGIVPTREAYKKEWIKNKIAAYKKSLQTKKGQPGAFLVNEDIRDFTFTLKQLIPENKPLKGTEPNLYEGFDFIITDPPYERAGIPLYENLSLFASHLLKPGGSILCLCGTHFLPEVLPLLSKHLNYHWTVCYDCSQGPQPKHYNRKVYQEWKPLIWMTKGKYTGPFQRDKILCPSISKTPNELHKWGQSPAAFDLIVEKFCQGGQKTIIDPFMGGGTTGLAALKHGHYFFGSDIDPDSYNTARGRLICA